MIKLSKFLRIFKNSKGKGLMENSRFKCFESFLNSFEHSKIRANLKNKGKIESTQNPKIKQMLNKKRKTSLNQ